MSKTTFNNIHIDLSDISLISQLEKKQGAWIASIVWRNTGMAMNLKMASIREEFAIIVGDEQIQEEKTAKENYDRLVKEWRASA